ncbi:prohibitin family protein [bacterium]|nr:prohibitin family protein [bacterium]
MTTKEMWQRSVIRIASIIITILFISSSFYKVVPAGYTGVVFNRFTGKMRSSGQGATFKIPFVTIVQIYPVSLRTYTMAKEDNDSMDLPTKEGQHIKQDLSVTYNTSLEKAADVFRSFKGSPIRDIEETFIRRTIITSAQNIAGQMSLTELISTNREKFQESITKDLDIELSKMGFHLDMVNLGASHLPESIEQQMQQKMASQQDAQKAEYELQKQEMLAKAEVAKATGEANSLLLKSKAQAESNKLINSTLNELLIENKKIEKWNGSLPQVVGNNIPILNIGTK